MILLYGAKDEKFNNAIALKEYLEEKLDSWFVMVHAIMLIGIECMFFIMN